MLWNTPFFPVGCDQKSHSTRKTHSFWELIFWKVSIFGQFYKFGTSKESQLKSFFFLFFLMWIVVIFSSVLIWCTFFLFLFFTCLSFYGQFGLFVGTLRVGTPFVVASSTGEFIQLGKVSFLFEFSFFFSSHAFLTYVSLYFVFNSQVLSIEMNNKGISIAKEGDEVAVKIHGNGMVVGRHFEEKNNLYSLVPLSFLAQFHSFLPHLSFILFSLLCTPICFFPFIFYIFVFHPFFHFLPHSFLFISFPFPYPHYLCILQHSYSYIHFQYTCIHILWVCTYFYRYIEMYNRTSISINIYPRPHPCLSIHTHGATLHQYPRTSFFFITCDTNWHFIFSFQISRESINAIKKNFSDELTKSDIQLIVELRKKFGII